MRTRTKQMILISLGVLAAAAGISTGLQHPTAPTPPPPPISGTANLFVGAAGSCTRSSTPVAYNAATSCGSAQMFQQAYNAAQNGDTIGVRAGTYATSQQIKYNAAKASGPAITFVPDGGHVLFTADMDFGNHFCSTPPPGVSGTRDSPEWITFDGGPSRDFEWGDRTHEVSIQLCPLFNHITFNRIKSGIEMPLAGPAIEVQSGSYFTLSNSIIGPSCCGNPTGTTGPSATGQATPWPVRISVRPPFSGVNYPNPDHVSVTDNDFEGAQRFCSNWDTVNHGTCPSFDATNLGAVHGDCIHVFGGSNQYYARNLFHRCNVQGLFLEDGVNTGVAGALQISATVENNMFSDFTESNKCGFCVGTRTSPGPFVVQGNSFDTSASIRFGVGNAQDSGDITIRGNIVPDMGSNGGGIGSCNPSTGTMVFHYSYNVWSTNTQGAPTDCGGALDAVMPSAAAYNALFTDSDPVGGNGILDLASTSSTPNGFWANSCLPVDFHGTSRPTPCDSGADEAGVVTINSGASLATCSPACTDGVAPAQGSAGQNVGCTAGNIAGSTNLVGVGNISDGVQSDCRLYGYTKPNNLQGSPAAVLIAGNDPGICGPQDPAKIYTTNHWHSVATSGRFIAVFLARAYDGANCRSGWYHPYIDVPDPGTTNPNDQNYIAAVVNSIKTQLNVDPNRIYMTGASGGGAITLDTACSPNSTLFRGFNPVSNFVNTQVSGGARVPNTERCPSTNQSFFYINLQGNTDGNVPYLGGCTSNHCIDSWTQNADFWGAHMGCTSGPATSTFGSPSSSNQKRAWQNCAFGITPAVGGGILIAGGCHAWQGLDAVVETGSTSTCAGGGTTNPTNGFNSAQYVWDYWAASQW